jgi:hypothetical protein
MQAPVQAHVQAPVLARPSETASRAPGMNVTGASYRAPMAAVVYLRMSPALRAALQSQAADNGVSLNAFAVQALAAAAGPEFLRDVRSGGKPASVADERRVVVRPSPDKMRPIVEQYVTYWVDRLGTEHFSRVVANSKDHDRVWAWYVGRQAELAELSSRGAR